MKHFKSKPVELSLIKLDRLYNAYLSSSVPKYKVTCIVVDKVTQYHVTNCETNVTHSEWKDLQVSLQVMRDLNRMSKKAS